jgi:hypothetical protein
MADEGALMKAWNQGRDELAAANRGDLAMGDAPVQQTEAPAVEPSSYEASLNQAAAQAESRSMEPDQGLSR